MLVLLYSCFSLFHFFHVSSLFSVAFCHPNTFIIGKDPPKQNSLSLSLSISFTFIFITFFCSGKDHCSQLMQNTMFYISIELSETLVTYKKKTLFTARCWREHHSQQTNSLSEFINECCECCCCSLLKNMASFWMTHCSLRDCLEWATVL